MQQADDPPLTRGRFRRLRRDSPTEAGFLWIGGLGGAASVQILQSADRSGLDGIALYAVWGAACFPVLGALYTALPSRFFRQTARG